MSDFKEQLKGISENSSIYPSGAMEINLAKGWFHLGQSFDDNATVNTLKDHYKRGWDSAMNSASLAADRESYRRKVTAMKNILSIVENSPDLNKQKDRLIVLLKEHLGRELE